MGDDFLNRLFIKVTREFRNLYYYWTTVNAIIVAKIIGVKIGVGFKCYGRIHFYKALNSNIEIQDNCQFRSKWNSNLIGITKNCIISTHSASAKILIKKNCGFSGVTIGCREYIEIGMNTLVGANSIISDTDWHSLNPSTRLTGVPNSKPIIIGNNVFIGVNSIILKGVTIGDNTVIGAGSVVVNNIPPNVIAAGNPCKILRNLNC